MTERVYKKLRWWGWILVIIWLAILIFFLQYAISSGAEYESRAALISWIIFIVFLALGLILLVRKKRT